MIGNYIRTYWLSFSFFIFLVFSTLLKAFTSIDITMPCLIKWLTDEECYGCGLTTATVALIKLQFKVAFETNALVYVVLPFLAFILINHFRAFKSQQVN